MKINNTHQIRKIERNQRTLICPQCTGIYSNTICSCASVRTPRRCEHTSHPYWLLLSVISLRTPPWYLGLAAAAAAAARLRICGSHCPARRCCPRRRCVPPVCTTDAAPRAAGSHAAAAAARVRSPSPPPLLHNAARSGEERRGKDWERQLQRGGPHQRQGSALPRRSSRGIVPVSLIDSVGGGRLAVEEGTRGRGRWARKTWRGSGGRGVVTLL